MKTSSSSYCKLLSSSKKKETKCEYFPLGLFCRTISPIFQIQHNCRWFISLAWYNRMKSELSTRKLSKDGAKKHQHSPFPGCLILCGALIKRLSLLMNLEGNLQHLNVHLIASVLEASLSKS